VADAGEVPEAQSRVCAEGGRPCGAVSSHRAGPYAHQRTEDAPHCPVVHAGKRGHKKQGGARRKKGNKKQYGSRRKWGSTKNNMVHVGKRHCSAVRSGGFQPMFRVYIGFNADPDPAFLVIANPDPGF
jgi:hypothetical protein